MSAFRLLPPNNRTDLEHGGQKVGPAGLDVGFGDVNALLATGWSFDKTTTKEAFDKAYLAYKKSLDEAGKATKATAKKKADAQAKKAGKKKGK